MAGRLRRMQQRDAGSYYREMHSIAAKAAMPHLPNAIGYIGARARVRHAHARICKKNDRQQTFIKIEILL